LKKMGFSALWFFSLLFGYRPSVSGLFHQSYPISKLLIIAL